MDRLADTLISRRIGTAMRGNISINTNHDQIRSVEIPENMVFMYDGPHYSGAFKIGGRQRQRRPDGWMDGRTAQKPSVQRKRRSSQEKEHTRKGRRGVRQARRLKRAISRSEPTYQAFQRGHPIISSDECRAQEKNRLRPNVKFKESSWVFCFRENCCSRAAPLQRYAGVA